MKKSERTKQFIVEQVAPIFNVKGYAGTSLSDMTSATGLTKGSIYGNFSGKDDVALAAFDYNLAKLQHIISGEMSKQTGTR
ncbi:MAG: TetR/AcrR family transcriptional regulator, partial [Flavipsychrobacter sp.]